jgi:hypothetical protein
MGVLKKIFIGLGSLFLVLVALFVWLGFESLRFKHEETPFVTAYLNDLSRHWQIADVYDRSANELISQVDSTEGRRTMQRFKPLGSLTTIHDFELNNYSHGTWGRRGVFDFKAGFQNGEALVEVTVLDKGGTGARVVRVYLTGIQMNPTVTGKLST